MGSVSHPMYTRACGDHGRVWVATRKPRHLIAPKPGRQRPWGVWDVCTSTTPAEGRQPGEVSKPPGSLSVTPGVCQGLLSMSGLGKVGWACLQARDDPPEQAFPKENHSPRAPLRPRPPNGLLQSPFPGHSASCSELFLTMERRAFLRGSTRAQELWLLPWTVLSWASLMYRTEWPRFHRAFCQVGKLQ